jgi:multidrug efflux pump subunit AcrA (membrane-fusion protein)
MNPSKVAVSLLFLTISLLLLGGCEGMPESNTPAFVPNPQPGAPIPGGLRIVSARATPLSPDIVRWKPGAVNVRFNGAATTPGVVEVSALAGDSLIYHSAGSAKFVPGQTEVQVPIKVDVQSIHDGIHEKTGEIPLKVSIRGSSAPYQAMTHYSGNR